MKDSRLIAERIAALADAKQAGDIVALDMRGLVSYTDFIVLCTVRNERQARAVVEEVRVQMKRRGGILPGGVEGEPASGWIVLDYLDCVLHVFTAEARERYRLEELWREAPRLDLDLEEPPASSAAAS